MKMSSELSVFSCENIPLKIFNLCESNLYSSSVRVKHYTIQRLIYFFRTVSGFLLNVFNLKH